MSNRSKSLQLVDCRSPFSTFSTFYLYLFWLSLSRDSIALLSLCLFLTFHLAHFPVPLIPSLFYFRSLAYVPFSQKPSLLPLAQSVCWALMASSCLSLSVISFSIVTLLWNICHCFLSAQLSEPIL